MKKNAKKDMRKEFERRLSRCLGCPHVRPKAFQAYPRLWDYLTCDKADEKILDIEVCWEGPK
ncbi:hypothetical protein [Acidaminococcus fermentans]|uniref:hypothetical protein n=1 Tax=Acidaminococcus fermentans TaxID=905 RepID=UPI002432EAE0|nr:hypothetical protein [Acidaminococcus fermentans]